MGVEAARKGERRRRMVLPVSCSSSAFLQHVQPTVAKGISGFVEFLIYVLPFSSIIKGPKATHSQLKQRIKSLSPLQ